MTTHKHLKQFVRARMAKTGERYATARRQVVSQAARATTGPAAAHLPGNVPGATALRILLTHAGAPACSEALTFCLAGGIGAGVFAFVYEKEDFASLFLAGRHSWHDEKAYLTHAAERLGMSLVVKEAGGAGPAEKQLDAALAEGRPVIAWVDAAHLPHRAMPGWTSGSAYHLVTIHAADAAHALIGDLADDPVSLTRAELLAARGRIKKDKFRLAWLTGAAPAEAGLGKAFQAGLAQGAHELATCKMKNFRLDAFQLLAERMVATKGKESWAAAFPPGPRLWTALTSLYQYIEHYGTGGGLCRPLFAEGLAEGAVRFQRPAYTAVAAHYAELGTAWSALAEAALPDAVPACHEAKALISRRSELILGGGNPDEVRACWDGLARLSAAARTRFPLETPAVARLLQELSTRLREIHAAEVVALEALAAV